MTNYNHMFSSGNILRHLHNLRFKWLARNLREKEGAYTLFELGCFDCRSLNFISKPTFYVGADAGWEGGIEDARMTYDKVSSIELVMAQSVQDLTRYKDLRFDYSIALETLQHLPDKVLRGYLAFLAKITQKRLLVSVPVEIGPVFLLKHLARVLFTNLENSETEPYTWKEVYWATRGHTQLVQRFGPKGFNYHALLHIMNEYFNITHIEGLPFRRFPYVSLQIGIIAEPKRKNA